MLVQSMPYPASAGGGGAPYGSHRYWRIYVDANNGDASLTAIAELQFKDSTGTNLVGSGTVLSGGSGTDGIGNDPSDGFDGNFSTQWARTATGTCWLGYDFGSAVAVHHAAIAPTSSGFVLARTPKTGGLEYSDDGSTWTRAEPFGPTAIWIPSTYETVPADTPAAGAHRAWRLLVDTATGTNLQLNEIELRLTSGGADQVPALTSDVANANGRIIFSAESGGNEAWRVFDNTTGTWFVSPGANAYIGYIFPTAQAITEMAITLSSRTDRAPKDIRIQSSDDAINWTDEDTRTGLSWTAGETKVFDF